MTTPILEFRTVSKTFARGGLLQRQGGVMAVDRVSLVVPAGRTVGLVGESGSGKSTLARIALGLMRPSSGGVYFDGDPIEHLSRRGWRGVRKRMQAIFQDPASSLNPRRSVQRLVQSPLDVHRVGSRSERAAAVAASLPRVGLDSEYLRRFPHQLSGGERQRVAIARALMVGPQLIIADEPTSAVDVSVQAQLIRLFADIQNDLGIAYLFISHNLAVVKHVADWVAVMYLGRIVEFGTRDEVFLSAQHPYTQALLASVPIPDPARKGLGLVRGELPSMAEIPSGCRFRDRCPHAFDKCAREDPPDYEPSPGKRVACHLLAPTAQAPQMHTALIAQTLERKYQ
ncbi:MAG TPA: ABC transporter ATP-binding protein [Candidatus Dormibacteraeota bacterium]|jgi:oligopeptide/dipeptide ABC transporter ATP-binding protein|nr:ABC transporter ATP-binding protein [Candidatus Dormibacteraeota bacterium]